MISLLRFSIALLLVFRIFSASLVFAQQQPALQPSSPQSNLSQPFRLERTEVNSGAELLTVWGRINGTDAEEIPLVSVLRDTLGDDVADNDLLRYVWMHTYAHPTKLQKAAATVPFLYHRVYDRTQAPASQDDGPPPIIDLAATDQDVWRRLFVSTILGFLTERYFLKAAALTYRRNVRDYRQAHVVQALAILSLYENTTGAPPALSESELREIQARLMLSDNDFGGLLSEASLQPHYRKQMAQINDVRGHNWELLRQRAEAEGLHFDPLVLPDGSTTHALLWVARADLAKNRGREFSNRFLNIRDPWRDERLEDWKGYVGLKYFDADNRPVEADAEGARATEMIPLALYGLDHPKIPALLVDFRDATNPKRREMTRRTIDDVTQYILSVSAFGDLYYTLGRTVFNFVTGRRGMDINQPSRIRTYAQMKVLLALSASLDPELRDEIGQRLERVSLNPLQNNSAVEQKLAVAQYEALVAYARRPDGLPARLGRDRRVEMTKFVHRRGERVLLKLANVASFGIYKHRERVTDERLRRLDMHRQLARHTKFLTEVVRSTPVIEVMWKIEDVRRSLRFIAEHSTEADDQAARLAALVFTRTEDRQTKELCLFNLQSIESQVAKRELRRLSTDKNLSEEWRVLIARYLESETAPLPRAEPKALSSMAGQ